MNKTTGRYLGQRGREWGSELPLIHHYGIEGEGDPTFFLISALFYTAGGCSEHRPSKLPCHHCQESVATGSKHRSKKEWALHHVTQRSQLLITASSKDTHREREREGLRIISLGEEHKGDSQHRRASTRIKPPALALPHPKASGLRLYLSWKGFIFLHGSVHRWIIYCFLWDLCTQMNGGFRSALKAMQCVIHGGWEQRKLKLSGRSWV